MGSRGVRELFLPRVLAVPEVQQQAHMRLLEIGDRGCRPGGMVLKALPVPEAFV